MTTEEFLGTVRVCDGEQFFTHEIVTKGDDIEVITSAVSDFRGLEANSPEEVVAYKLFCTPKYGNNRKIIFKTTDRDTARTLHLQFVEAYQKDSIDKAIQQLLSNPLAVKGIG